MNAARRIVIGLILVAAAMVIWLGVRGDGSSPRSDQADPLGTGAQRFVGKWTFVDGTMKSDWDFHADPQKHEMSLVGKSMTVFERDGALWTALDGDPCSILLAPKGNDAVEMVPGRVVCGEQAVDAPKKSNAKMVQLAIALDASGRGHVAGTSQFSLAASGQVHEGRLDFAGVAEKQVGAGH